MTLIICPGIHPVALSDRFLAALQQQLADRGEANSARLPRRDQVLPTERYAPFNGVAVWSFLQAAADPQEPLLLLGFSAGVAGAIAAAQLWEAQGRQVAALIALDGWGVPQWGNFPLHRVSHDYFTHWSSAMLGAGHDSFYADPPVAHLDLWQAPDRAVGVVGLHTGHESPPAATLTAIEFIGRWVRQYDQHDAPGAPP